MASIRRVFRVVKSTIRWWLPLLGSAAFLLMPRLLWAQDDDLAGYTNVYPTFSLIVKTVLYSGAYLLIYAAALTLTLKSLGRFFEFDGQLLCWIALLWLGGMVANGIGYHLIGPRHPFLAALATMPLIFASSLLICTREWTDLLFSAALRVAIVVTVVCAPYFGPTWYLGLPAK